MIRKYLAVVAWHPDLFHIWAPCFRRRPARVDSESAGPSRLCRTVRSLSSVRWLVSLDFPWSFRAVWLLVLGSAVALELFQIVIPDQDARIIYAAKN
jgi:hypothetical protein